jgi:hypothetical protein
MIETHTNLVMQRILDKITHTKRHNIAAGQMSRKSYSVGLAPYVPPRRPVVVARSAWYRMAISSVTQWRSSPGYPVLGYRLAAIAP